MHNLILFLELISSCINNVLEYNGPDFKKKNY